MSETGFPSPAALRNGEAELIAHVQTVCDRIDAEDPLIQALLPEPARRQRLTLEAEALLASFPDPAARPSLFGLLVGVKDFFRVDGFPTKAGSKLPAALFDGAESEVVTLLKQNGALIAGKTVTTESPTSSRARRATRATRNIRPAARAAARLRGWLLVSFRWRWAPRRSARSSARQPSAGLSASSPAMTGSLPLKCSSSRDLWIMWGYSARMWRLCNWPAQRCATVGTAERVRRPRVCQPWRFQTDPIWTRQRRPAGSISKQRWTGWPLRDSASNASRSSQTMPILSGATAA